ncbi:hypothetical protein EMIT048CA2_180030 [Pseudomonas chlororaphis]
MCGIPLTSAAFQQYPVVLSAFLCLFSVIPWFKTRLDVAALA